METNDKIINGKIHADNLLKKIYPLSVDYIKKYSKKPTLAVVLIGNDPASEVYVKNKITTANKNNINSLKITFSNEVYENILLDKIIELNNNPDVHGILVQLPLPKHISEKLVIQTINPEKDVDGFHPTNYGNLFMGSPSFIPCTPLGCFYMLKKEIPDLTGKNAVIIGRSNIVGKPMASLLLSSNCTVTIAHSKTINLIETCKKADILIAAIGKPEMINEDYIKKNAIIIDVGINRIEQNDLSIKNNKSKLVGDVNYNKVFDIVDKITPVPGGVGPMTIACLMHNTLKAAFLNKKDPFINILESM